MPDAPQQLMTLSTALGAGVLKFRSLQASEELGRLFEFNVGALSENRTVDFADLLGTPACVHVELPDGSRRHFNGIVTSAGVDAAAGRLFGYSLTLRPWLWLLTRRADTRIFQNLALPDILKKVFEPYAGEVKFELSASYPSYEYCVQYRETDFNFVSRLMEQEGIYYYFRHAESAHTLVLVDKMSAHEPYPGHADVLYAASHDGMLDTDAVTDWRTSHEVQPGKVTLNDYNFTTPATTLLAESASTRKTAKAQYEHYDPPGEYPDKAAGERYAGLRMEEIEARFMRAVGAGNVRGIAVGHRFTLKEHPRAAENAEHVVVSTRIDASLAGYESGNLQTYFHCGFSAIGAGEVFRSQRETPKPTVAGPQTAVVVGKAGEEIDTDEYGRVKVQFHWDRLGKKDEKSSCWVRVSHPLRGQGVRLHRAAAHRPGSGGRLHRRRPGPPADHRPRLQRRRKGALRAAGEQDRRAPRRRARPPAPGSRTSTNCASRTRRARNTSGSRPRRTSTSTSRTTRTR